MQSNGGTPFDENGWANVIADIRRLYLLVGGGSNDLNQASTDVTQDATAGGENANNAFKIRNVNVSTVAPTDGQPLTYSSARKQYEGNSGAGGGGTFLQAGNNLSELTSKPTARTTLGLGSAAVLSSTGVMLPANNLSDVASVASARTNLGLGTGDVVSHSALTLGAGLSVGGATAFTGIHIGNGAIGQVLQETVVIASGGTFTFLTASGNPGKMLILGSDPGSGGTPYTSAGAGQTIAGLTGSTLGANRIELFIADGTSNWYRLAF